MKTYGDIKEKCLDKARIATAQTAYVTMIENAINKVYLELLNMKKWWFLRVQRDVVIPAKYITGTASVTNGSRIVTLGGGASVLAAFKNRFFNAGETSEVYKIVSVDSSDRLILSAPFVGTTNAASTYTIWQGEIGLWPDCEEVDDVWHDQRKYHCLPCGPRQMSRLLARDPKYGDYMKYYTKSGRASYAGVPLGNFLLGYDFLTGTGEHSENLIFWPACPSSDYLLHIVYIKLYGEMTQSSHRPVLPHGYNYMLVDGALAEFYDDLGRSEKAAIHRAKYRKKEQELIQKQEATDDLPCLNAKYRTFEDIDESNVAWGDEWDSIW